MTTTLGVHRVAPAHCTGELAFKIFKEGFGEDYSYAGLESVVQFSQNWGLAHGSHKSQLNPVVDDAAYTRGEPCQRSSCARGLEV